MESVPSTWCSFVPDTVLEPVVQDDQANPEVRNAAESTLKEGRNLRTTIPLDPNGRSLAAVGLQRFIYDSGHSTALPGTLCLADGQFMPTGDQHIVALWHRLGHIYNFFEREFGYKLFDGTGNQIHVTICWGQNHMSGYWAHNQVILGSGSPAGLKDFYNAEDVLAHELTHGIIHHTSNLTPFGETGALGEHLADVFGLLFKQYYYYRKREAASVPWTIGEKLFGRCVQRHKSLKPVKAPMDFPHSQPYIIPLASGPGSQPYCILAPQSSTSPHWAPPYLRCFEDPGSALPPQPCKYGNFNRYLKQDRGGVHHNSGIPNFAFHTAAIKAGGPPWDGVGRVWFRAMVDGVLGSDCEFLKFAWCTIYHARVIMAEVKKKLEYADKMSESEIEEYLKANDLVAPVIHGWVQAEVLPLYPSEKIIKDTTKYLEDRDLSLRTHSS